MNDHDLAKLASIVGASVVFGFWGKGLFRSKMPSTQGGKSTIVSAPNTRMKRICLAAFPFSAIASMALIFRDTHGFYYLDDLHFTTVILSTATASLPVIGLTKLIEWVQGNE